MNTLQKNAAWLVLGVAAAGVYIASGRDARGAAQEVPAATERRIDHAGAQAFWWKHMGAQSGAAVWFSPMLGEAGSRTRFWALSAVRPGSEAPMLCLWGEVPAWKDERLRLRVGEMLVQLQPLPGLTWGDLRDAAGLDAHVEGLY